MVERRCGIVVHQYGTKGENIMQADKNTLLVRGTIVQKKDGDLLPAKWVYQLTAAPFGNLGLKGRRHYQMRRHVIPFDPQSATQLAQRNKLRQATLSWQALPQAQKDLWRSRASKRPITGYQLYISRHMRGGV